MKLRAATIRTLFGAEMRMVLRDRRLIVTSILLPMLVMPLLFLGSNWSLKHREAKLRRTICPYAVSGLNAAAVRSLVSATRERLEAEGKTRGAPFGFEEIKCDNPRTALARGDVQIVLEGLIASENETNRPIAALDTSAKTSPSVQTAREADEEGEPAMPGTLVVRIVFRGDRDFSTSGLMRISELLEETRRVQRRELLKRHGFPLSPGKMAAVKEIDLASKGHVAGLALGRAITVLLLMFSLMGGAVVATDSLAGEKERGTLETLLTTSVDRLEVIVAKHLVILGIALIITLIQLGNLLVYVGFKLMPLPANFAAAMPPSVVVLMFFLFLPVLALSAAVLLLISGYSKTYKEAQMYFFPVFLIALVPALTPFIPGLSLRSAIVLVPVANIALAVREILAGAFDWPMIALSWVTTAGAAVWITRVSVRFLSAEKLITASERDVVDFTGGRALFERHALRWFAVLWAALLIINNYLEKVDLRWQLIINLVVLFFGASCLMLWSYRLEVRTTLALRAPKPAVWVAVLFAVPSGLIAASGLFRLANLFIPVSTQLMQQFDQAVIPPGISWVQLFFFLAVLPGVFEEITFRGLLLHGLSRRLHPAALALTVGVIFGVFHVALFRFAPTACLGVLLATVTLLSGSIFPAMLWHCLSNVTSILIYKTGIPLEELDPSSYLIGIAILAASFWIIWRNRTPYPELRGGEPEIAREAKTR